MASPRSPRNETRYDARGETPTARSVNFDDEPVFMRTGISEREAARQAWLDRERDREVDYFDFESIFPCD